MSYCVLFSKPATIKNALASCHIPGQFETCPTFETIIINVSMETSGTDRGVERQVPLRNANFTAVDIRFQLKKKTGCFIGKNNCLPILK